MRIPTKVRLHHGHLLAGGLRAVRAAVHSHRARVAIVGGSQISIAQAPWQVIVLAFFSETKVLICGGSILNKAEILTAGHCVYNPNTSEQIPADQIVVVAGTADFEVEEAEEQVSLASTVRVHPYYVYNPTATRAAPDDVALLKLEKSFVSKPTAEPIDLTVAGSLPQEGAAVNLTGFGEENPLTEELNGKLYSIDMALGLSQGCGGEADALFLCASTPSGSLCLGDSGSGLTISGSPVTLTGVADTVQVISGVPCRDGARGGFANVAAPEIQDFIDGSESPPLAPRGGEGIVIRGVLRPGQSLSCEPGGWSNNPTFTYAFINSAGEQVLQQGSSSTYPLSTADVGRTIFCQVQATNAGGTGIVRTTALPPIESSPVISPPPPPPHTPAIPSPASVTSSPSFPSQNGPIAPEPRTAESSGVSLAGTNLTVQSNGSTAIKLDCKSADGCAGKLTLSVTLSAKSTVNAKGKKKVSRTTTIETSKFSIAAEETTVVTIKLDATGRSLLNTDHGRLAARLAILELEPDAGHTQTANVHLTLQKPHGKAKK